jgi:hypothetical protein
LSSLQVIELGAIVFQALLIFYTKTAEALKRDLCFERLETETSIQNYSSSMH